MIQPVAVAKAPNVRTTIKLPKSPKYLKLVGHLCFLNAARSFQITRIGTLYNNHRKDDALTIETIKTQLEAAKWPNCAEVQRSVAAILICSVCPCSARLMRLSASSTSFARNRTTAEAGYTEGMLWP